MLDLDELSLNPQKNSNSHRTQIETQQSPRPSENTSEIFKFATELHYLTWEGAGSKDAVREEYEKAPHNGHGGAQAL